jgi:hypothetical protein
MRAAVLGGRKKILNERLHNLYSSPNIISEIKSRRMRWTGHVARMGMRNAFMMLVGNPESKKPLGRSSRRWEDIVKIDNKEALSQDMDCPVSG